MGLFNWLWAGRRRGSNPPAPSSKPEPPAGPPIQPPGRSGLTWEAAINGLRDLLADQTESAVQPVWQRARILTAIDLMAANPPSPPPPRNWIDPAKEKRSAELAEQLGLSPQSRRKPQPPGGRLLVNGIEQPPAGPVFRSRSMSYAEAMKDHKQAVAHLHRLRASAPPSLDGSLQRQVRDTWRDTQARALAANHRSLLDLEANFRAWYENKYGEPYFGAIPIIVAIEWGQHLLQQHAPPGEKPEFPPPRKIREDFLP